MFAFSHTMVNCRGYEQTEGKLSIVFFILKSNHFRQLPRKNAADTCFFFFVLPDQVSFYTTLASSKMQAYTIAQGHSDKFHDKYF